MGIDEVKVGDTILFMGATTREGKILRISKTHIEVTDYAKPMILGSGWHKSWIKPELVIEVLESK